MRERETKKIFNKDTTASYDNDREKLAPIKNALHLCIRMLGLKLPPDSRVLCVGVGTGEELIYLAEAFPSWQFTAVEPSSAMLEVCRQRVEERGFSSRCNFHEGYLGSLPDSDAFNMATSILVSHFIVDKKERIKYFTEISSKLHPGSYMVNADLASDMSTSEYESLLEVWLNMHDYAGMPVRVESFGDKVAMLPAVEVEEIVRSSGFETPVQFFQTLLIHAWFSKVKSGGIKANK